MPNTQVEELPPLPMLDVGRENLYGYSADQMRAYARAALEAHARALAQPMTEEVQRLNGERDLLCEVLRECDKVISTIEPESTDEDAGLRRLLGSIKRITLLHQADERDLFRAQGLNTEGE